MSKVCFDAVQQVGDYLFGGELARLALTCTRLYTAFNQVSLSWCENANKILGTWVRFKDIELS